MILVMEQEKNIFDIVNEIDKNILYQQKRMQEYYNGNFCCELGYKDAKLKIKELLQQRKQILKMNKKYGLSNFNYCDDKKNKDAE